MPPLRLPYSLKTQDSAGGNKNIKICQGPDPVCIDCPRSKAMILAWGNISLILFVIVQHRCPLIANWAYGISGKPYLRGLCRCNDGIRIFLLTLNRSAGYRNGCILRLPHSQHNGSSDTIPYGLRPKCFSCLLSRLPPAHHAPAEKSDPGQIYNWSDRPALPGDSWHLDLRSI